MKTYYIVSGGFDPIHEGHVEMIKASAQASDGVIVLANSDDWLCRKKGKNFHTMKTRKAILENLKGVVDVLEFDDTDNSACDGIKKARAKYPDAHLVFANGGDRGILSGCCALCCGGISGAVSRGGRAGGSVAAASGQRYCCKNCCEGKCEFISDRHGVCSPLNLICLVVLSGVVLYVLPVYFSVFFAMMLPIIWITWTMSTRTITAATIMS